MNAQQLEEFKAIPEIHEKAKYLLQFKITAKTDIVDLTFVSRAYIGDIALPATGATDEEAIANARQWLQEKAEQGAPALDGQK